MLGHSGEKEDTGGGEFEKSHHISAVMGKRPSCDLFELLTPLEAEVSQEPDSKPSSLRTSQAK